MKKKSMAVLMGLIVCFLSLDVMAQADQLFNQELLKAFSYRALGPARQGGRILRIVVPESQPYTFYVVTASGGLWKTVNNGTTFTPIFDNGNYIALGDMAVAKTDPNILWVGTGTPASGRITLRGDGVYKSIDGGKSWTHMGLEKTIHIGRIAIHPKNPDIVYVAAMGFHFSSNSERGLFKTIDGGKTWEKILYVSENAGFVEVRLDPQNPDTVYAASYDKHRVPWHFEETGPDSAIYKSGDAGKNWEKLTKGLPKGKLGRIGIAIYPNNPKILYATIGNGNLRPPTKKEIEQAKKLGRKPMERKIGGEVYCSKDAGESWEKRSPDGMSISGGKWYGVIYIDPNDENVIYVPGTPLGRSLDGGRTWGKDGIDNIAESVHVDHHAIWIDPADSNHIILGNDGGLAVTWDWGKTWDVIDNIPLAQFYAIGVDMDEPYNIYGGLQDCGSVKIPSNSLFGHIDRDDCFSVGGGDGMFNQIDPHNSRWLYNEYQLGVIQRVDQKLGIRTSIRPRRGNDQKPYRFNWTAPIHISPHNSRIIFHGAEFLLRSLDRGDNWQEISPDLTTNDPEKLKGNIEHCTIISISESPLTAGIIWVGTDDGKVQLTKNGGGTWTDLTPILAKAGAPGDYYVSRVYASHFKEEKVYVVKTGFQRDDYKPYIFVTEDFGQTWTSISGNLPPGTVHVIVEDHVNPELLFVGKEMGVYVSLDGGNTWVNMKNNMPTQDVYDLVIHPRENDLVVGTHGRGIFVTDISPHQEMTTEMLQKDVHLFKIEPKIQWQYRSGRLNFGDRLFEADNEPVGLVINYYLKQAAKDKVEIFISTPYGDEITVLKGKSQAGINQVVWDMRRKLTEAEKKTISAWQRRRNTGVFVSPGEYLVTLKKGDKEFQQKALVKAMPEQE